MENEGQLSGTGGIQNAAREGARVAEVLVSGTIRQGRVRLLLEPTNELRPVEITGLFTGPDVIEARAEGAGLNIRGMELKRVEPSSSTP